MDENINFSDFEITDADIDAMGDDLFDGWDDDLDTENADDENEVIEETETADEDESEDDSAYHTDESEEESEATEDESETESKDAEKAKEENTTPHEPQKYTLKHFDDTLELTAEELVPLAQKGMDYDRIRSERDTMKKDYAKLQGYAEFLDKIKGDSFESIEDLMDDTIARLLQQKEGLSFDTALSQAKADREHAEKAKQPVKEEPDPVESTEKANAEEVKNFTKAFHRAFPNEAIPTWDKLPASVRKEFEETGNLIGPYMEYRLSKKDEEIKTIKNNQKNKEKSTGSRKTKGKGVAFDPMFEGFGDDD